jgi:hypothetical protein
MKFPKFNLPLITFLSVAVGCTLLSTYPVQFNDSSTLDNVVQKCASHVENNPPIYESFVDGAIKDCVNKYVKNFVSDKQGFSYGLFGGGSGFTSSDDGNVHFAYSSVSKDNTLEHAKSVLSKVNNVRLERIQLKDNKKF